MFGVKKQTIKQWKEVSNARVKSEETPNMLSVSSTHCLGPQLVLQMVNEMVNRLGCV